ncbi:cobalamin biosynthesis protein [Sinorhizobium sp. BG8]|uniref:cobalamin biosynthesis protein n=1 Tax=Sinorhizobium sp. BG8 TaxID=2613773 RepID=UPI00193D65C9|nr:cobalamin biosynthesis protein [Sinorhizobium sp. BG8]QRM55785.1 cobalamin biosynthesis protein [Sinorhizobium sp. BG8]
MIEARNGRPARLVLGLGCERGTDAAEVISLAEEALMQGGFLPSDLSLVASLDTRAHEPAMRAAAGHFGIPFITFDAARLEQETSRLASPSTVVFAHTGCHGVAEGAALAASGPSGRLAVTKIRSPHATAAIAESDQLFAENSSQGESASLHSDSTDGEGTVR